MSKVIPMEREDNIVSSESEYEVSYVKTAPPKPRLLKKAPKVPAKKEVQKAAGALLSPADREPMTDIPHATEVLHEVTVEILPVVEQKPKKPRAPRKKKVVEGGAVEAPAVPVAEVVVAPVEVAAATDEKPKKPRKSRAKAAVEGESQAEAPAPKPKRPLNSWARAVKQWNAENNSASYIVPKKGTPEYDTVKALSDQLKAQVL